MRRSQYYSLLEHIFFCPSLHIFLLLKFGGYGTLYLKFLTEPNNHTKDSVFPCEFIYYYSIDPYEYPSTKYFGDWGDSYRRPILN